MSDIIHLRAMKLTCILGILPEERTTKRAVVATLRLVCDTRTAGRNDDIADTVDYRTVHERVEKAVGVSRDGLIERLAERIADAALSVAGVRQVTVILDKPNALPHCASVAIEITRP
ncbi:MAG: dihydroneopterin aldolase [Kiritimatiellaeota bacterium]|nr:dihydroneopterin aldolase [Kiritimatiellota bacterium]